MHKLLTKIEAEDMDRVRYAINCRLDSIFSDWAIIWWWIRPERTTIVFQGSSDACDHARKAIRRLARARPKFEIETSKMWDLGQKWDPSEYDGSTGPYSGTV